MTVPVDPSTGDPVGRVALYYFDGSGNPVRVSATSGIPAKDVKSATGVQSSVASSASSVTVLASNAARLGATITNDSTSPVNLLLVTGGTASATAFTVRLNAKGAVPDYYEVPFGYTGDVVGIWDSAAGSARVTEFTA